MPMFSKPFSLLRGLIVSLAAGTLIACGGGGSNDTASPTTSTNQTLAVTALTGKVLDAAGAPLAGATVSAAGKSATTGTDGSYAFNLDSTTTSTVVLVKKSGFTTTAKDVPIAAGISTQVNFALLVDQVSTTFSATAAKNVSVSGATVQFTANSIKLADGGDYTGTVVIGASYFSPDTVQGAQAFAGPYTGVDAGVPSPLISMGFMEVKLSDPAGRPLQMKDGSPATLTFPRSSVSGTATEVPLWFYDEATKIWKREGVATRQADGSFQGTVAHFTIWNADFPGQRATLKGCFRDSAGQVVTNVGSAAIRTTGWSHWVGGNNPDGNFTILNVPANVPFELYSTATPPAFATITIAAITPGATVQLNCITATANISTTTVIVTTPGSVFVPGTNTGTVTGTTTGTVTGTTTGTVTATTTGTVTGTTTGTVTGTTTGTITGTTTGVVGTTSTTVTTTTSPGTASFAGSYTGTYGGAETGTFNVSINTAGVVGGTNFSQTYNQTFAVSGQVGANGSLALAASGSAGSARFTGSISAAGVVSGTWVYVAPLVGGGTFTGTRAVAPTPATTFTGVINPDKYVGTWSGCYVPEVGISTFINGTVTTTFVNSTTTSSRDIITFTKSGTNSLAISSINTDFNGTTCSGVGTNTQTATLTMVIVGQKLLSSNMVDLVNLSFGAASGVTLPVGTTLPQSGTLTQKTVLFISGTSMFIGDSLAAPLDANGYPTALDPSPIIKQ